MEKLKPYPAYRDSGVPWLGEVPEIWAVKRLRNSAEMRVSNVDKHSKEDERPVRLCNYVDVYKNDRIRSGIPFMRATATAEEIERFRLCKNDVLITKDSEAWNDIGVPALVEETADDLICGYHLALLRPFMGHVEGGYLYRALQSTAVAHQFHVEANGVTRYGLSHSAIKSTWLPLPPLPEQAAIVRYLDYMDRRIQRYIRAKQKLIKLLEEQKQAIIHQAVTGQIDVRTGKPYPTYKPSGVEWLGDVPEHWEVTRFKNVANVDGSLVDPRVKPYCDMILVAPNHVGKDGSSLLLESVTASSQGADSGKYLVKAGRIIYTKIRPYLRKAVIAPVDCLCSADMYPIRARHQSDVLQGFLLLVMLSEPFTQYTVDCSLRAAMPKVNREALGGAPFWLPKPQEQERVVEFTSAARARIDPSITCLQHQIEVALEYRTRLISDVVTGKLDVREAAANLPEELEEELPVDQEQEEQENEDLENEQQTEDEA